MRGHIYEVDMDSDQEVREVKLDACSSQVLQQIARLERRIFPKHESLASSLPAEARKKNSGLLYAVFSSENSDHPPASEPSSSEILVAGYVMYSFTSSVAASITKLAVRETCRKQGYGSSLLKAAIRTCRSRRPVCRVSLHVDPVRVAAMGLYRKMGFKVDAIVESYYAPHRDAYRMFLDFDTS